MPFDAWAQTAPAHFHHLHLNATNPSAAIDFYTRTFDSEKGMYDGQPAVWAQKSWLLFNKVDAPPAAEVTSTIWHFGWGAENMPETYQQQLAKGTRFSWPLTELFPQFFYAYVAGPDRAIIELNTAAHHHFGHLHLLSADAVSAGEWYVKHFGAARRGNRVPSRQASFLRGYQIGPSHSLMMDNVNIIIFAMEYARQQWPKEWKNRAGFVTTKGRVVDHIAFSVDNLAQALPALEREGVTILSRTSRTVMIEGPDHIQIELVEGHARRE